MRAGWRCSTRRWRRRRKPPSVPRWNWAAPRGSAGARRRGAAAQTLSASATPDTRRLLNERAALEDDAQVQAALQAALRAIDGRLAWGERLGALFSGISLGSILLLVALG